MPELHPKNSPMLEKWQQTSPSALVGKIRDLRRQRGWRQIDLAAHAELSKTHICELEVGRREVGPQDA